MREQAQVLDTKSGGGKGRLGAQTEIQWMTGPFASLETLSSLHCVS